MKLITVKEGSHIHYFNIDQIAYIDAVDNGQDYLDIDIYVNGKPDSPVKLDGESADQFLRKIGFLL